MRQFLALATLFVLSLSRFGAPAPVHARTWVVDRVTSELGAAIPGARLAAPAAHELAQRGAPRVPAPWLPADVAIGPDLATHARARAETPAGRTWQPLPAWQRFTYDATAPPPLS